MIKLEPIITPNINLQVLSNCVDLTEIDKKSSKPADKLSSLALSMFSLNPIHQWLYFAFYFQLPIEVVEHIINEGHLKVAYNCEERFPHGFISGSMDDFSNFILKVLKPDAQKHLRYIGNLLYTYFNQNYNLFSNTGILQLPDKTFYISG